MRDLIVASGPVPTTHPGTVGGLASHPLPQAQKVGLLADTFPGQGRPPEARTSHDHLPLPSHGTAQLETRFKCQSLDSFISKTDAPSELSYEITTVRTNVGI